jgi:hypothetical protein
VIPLAEQVSSSEVNIENTSNFPSLGYCRVSCALWKGVVLTNTNTSVRRFNPYMTMSIQLQPLLRTEEMYSTLQSMQDRTVY